MSRACSCGDRHKLILGRATRLGVLEDLAGDRS
jgi:hypothetical protein